MVCSAMGIFRALFFFPALRYVSVCVQVEISSLIPISRTYDKGIQDHLKGIVHPKTNILSLFTHLCVIPNPYSISTVSDNKIKVIEVQNNTGPTDFHWKTEERMFYRFGIT